MTIAIADLPHFNAAFNGLTIVFLSLGFYFIVNRDPRRHMRAMLAALAASSAFLVTYLIYHYNAGLAKFGGEGTIRTVYFTLLIAHVAIAAAITPLVPITVYRALTGRFARHRRIARWTWPLWMFVAISGVVVYVMADHLFPDAAGPYADG